MGIITFDIPGIGDSATPCFPYLPANMADLAKKLLDHLGYVQVDVLGVSWGGVVAQEFVRRHARTCRRLILAATSTGVVIVTGHPWALLGMPLPPPVLRSSLRSPLATLWGATWGGDFRRDPSLGRRYLRHIRWHSMVGQAERGVSPRCRHQLHPDHAIAHSGQAIGGKAKPILSHPTLRHSGAVPAGQPRDRGQRPPIGQAK